VLYDNRLQRLKEVFGIAAAFEKQTGCPAQLMIAQRAIESEWGAKPVGHAGYFGMKRAAPVRFPNAIGTELFPGDLWVNWLSRQKGVNPANDRLYRHCLHSDW
jgi:hypothetical protein